MIRFFCYCRILTSAYFEVFPRDMTITCMKNRDPLYMSGNAVLQKCCAALNALHLPLNMIESFQGS